jgi:hypothetical protein
MKPLFPGVKRDETTADILCPNEMPVRIEVQWQPTQQPAARSRP